MNIRQTEAFKAVMEKGTVSQAADALGISQPAVSKLIAAFELSAGFVVFERVRGRLNPTPEAKLLYHEVERIFSGIDEIGRAAADIRDRRQGRLEIGVLPALTAGFIQKVIVDFLEGRPKVTVSMQARTSQKILEAVAVRKLDLGITLSPPDYPGVRSDFLHRARGVCIIPRNHLLASKDKISPTDLDGEPFISLSPLDGSRQRVNSSFEQSGARPDMRIETPMAASACAFVAQGAGVSIVDPFSPQAFPPDSIAIKHYEREVNFDYFLTLPENDRPSALVQEFNTTLQDAFQAG